MDVALMLARMQGQREFDVELPNGRTVRMRRPPEVELPQMIGGVRLQHVVDAAVGWNFTEADLLGAAIGAEDEVPFDRALWREYVADNAPALEASSRRLAEAVSDYLKRKGETAKN